MTEFNKKPLVTIFTCVFNRAHTINRVFSSVRSQTYNNIEHIIVDDGSTDGVWSLIEQYANKADYPVIIFKKNNGGKHTATNIAWDLASGEYIVQLDSDDELLPHAIEYLVGLWNQIPPDHIDEYWCVHGRCRTQFSSELVGSLYPDNINSLSHLEAQKVARTVSGEKIGMMKRSVLRNENGEIYKYPEPVGVKFVNESVLWKPLNIIYRTWYSNEIVRIYYVDEGECLTKQSLSYQTLTNRCWNAKWVIEHRKEFQCNFKRELLKYMVYFPLTCYTYRQHNRYLLDNSDSINVLLLILYPIVFFAKPFVRKYMKLN